MKQSKYLLLAVSLLALSSCATSDDGTTAQVDMALERAAKRADISKDPTQKLALYERVYKRNPQSAKAAVEYARVLRQSGQISRADTVLSAFAESADSPHYAYAEYAAVKLAKGEHGEAEIFARDALKKKEGDSYALHTLGIALDGLGKYSEAEEAFRSALDNWEGNPVPVMNNLALNLATQGYIDESISILERAKTLEPERKELERNLRIIRALNENNAEYFPDQQDIPMPKKKPKAG